MRSRITFLTMRRAIFLRLMAALFALAFASYYSQLPSTLGPAGVDPAHALLEQRRAPGAPLDAFAAFPSAAWLLDAVGVPPSVALDVCALTGIALASAVAVGVLTPTPLTCASLPFLYLSLVNGGRPWLEAAVGGADGLLIEAGWAAALWSVASPPPVGPLLLLRWVAAKAAWTGALVGLTPLRAAWFGEEHSVTAAGAAVGALVLAPLALAPARAARAAAAVGTLLPAVTGWPVPVRGWPLALRFVLTLPLLVAAEEDSGQSHAPTPLRAGAAALSLVCTLVPATQLAVDLLRFSEDPLTLHRLPAASDAAVRQAAARAAPPLITVAAVALAIALGFDLWRSLLAVHGDPFAVDPRRPRSAGEAPRPRLPSAGATPAALAGAAAFLIFAAGAVDVLSTASGTPFGGCATCGAPRAFVAAAKLTYAARPWRAAGGGGGAPAGTGLALQVRYACDDGDDDDETGWTTLAEQSPAASLATLLHTPRLPPALATAAVDGWRHTSPWAFHAAALLAGGDASAVALATALGAPRSDHPPCAARVIDAVSHTPLTHALTPDDVTPPGGDVDAASDVALELARHGWGPLVRYSADEDAAPPFFRLAALVAAPRALGATGAGVAGVGVAAVGVARAVVAARPRPRRARALAKRD